MAKLLNGPALLDSLSKAANAVGLVLTPTLVPVTETEDEHILVDEETIVEIYPGTIGVRTLKGMVGQDGYVVTTTNVVPATRWEPEDAEVHEEKATQAMGEAIMVALQVVLERRFAQFSEAGVQEAPEKE